MTTPIVELQANKLKPVHPKPQHDKILYCQRATSQVKDARLGTGSRIKTCAKVPRQNESGIDIT